MTRPAAPPPPDLMERPRTAAGRALLADLAFRDHYTRPGVTREAILAIEAEAARREAAAVGLLQATLIDGCPPDAMMDSSSGGQALRAWWLNRWAPVYGRIRLFLHDSAGVAARAALPAEGTE